MDQSLVVVLGILRDILDFIDPSDICDTEQFKQAVTMYLDPVVKHFREASLQEIERYRSAGGATGASRQYQALFTRLIVAANVGFESQFLVEYDEEQRTRERTRRTSLAEDQIVLLLAGEKGTLEIKGSLFLDINRLLLGDGRKEKLDEVTEEVLSTVVGFLNGQRVEGRLVIGAIETKQYKQDRIQEVLGDCLQFGPHTVVGIENDYHYEDWDKYERQIRDLVKDHITPHVESSLDIEPVQVGDRTLAVVTVKRDPNRWCYLDDRLFCVRLGPRTRVLTGREADDYRVEWAGKTV